MTTKTKKESEPPVEAVLDPETPVCNRLWAEFPGTLDGQMPMTLSKAANVEEWIRSIGVLYAAHQADLDKLWKGDGDG